MHFSSPRSLKAWHPQIWAHLYEFTSRLLRCLLMVCVVFLISLTFHASGVAQSSAWVASFKIWSHDCFFSCSGKRKALKLNFANPPIKPTTRFTLNTAGPPFQNPHMWVTQGYNTYMLGLFLSMYQLSSPCASVRERLRTHSIESSGKLKLSPEQHWDFTAEDLKDLGEIGRGAYGSVNKMVHKPSNKIMAVKVIYFFNM